MQDIAVVLMHDTKDITAEYLDQVIDQFESAGYTFGILGLDYGRKIRYSVKRRNRSSTIRKTTGLTVHKETICMREDKEQNRKTKQQDRNTYVGMGISFGLMGGAALSTIIGLLFDFPLIWAFGPGFGMLMGILIGSVMDSKRNNE